MNEINEDQVVEYIKYNIKQVMNMSSATFEEAVENVRYYMDFLISSVMTQMENQ